MIAVYPGSFDPVTLGHVDIIGRAAKITNKLVVAVLKNSSKSPMFNVQERVETLREVCLGIRNVEIAAFDGLLVEYARSIGANAIIRGLRAVTDFEYEFQMALSNRMLDDNIETLFISTNAQYSYISSSVVKEIARLGGDFSQMVPKAAHIKLLQKMGSM
ncbi:MAG: pantetheine-phosphate adenylyltransferase [Defluviitaleaceae bacterium]|nr:pantetheine-phosphate adenylyltransferase [Defluviitaleaceae bacterium]